MRAVRWTSAVVIIVSTLLVSLYLDESLLLSEWSLRHWVGRILSEMLDSEMKFEEVSFSISNRSLTLRNISLTRTEGGFLSADIRALDAYIDIKGCSLSLIRAEGGLVRLRMSRNWEIPLKGILKETETEEVRYLPTVGVHNIKLSLLLPEGTRKRQLEADFDFIELTPLKEGGFEVSASVTRSSLGEFRAQAVFRRDGRPLSFHINGRRISIRRLVDYLPSEIGEAVGKLRISGVAEIMLDGEYREGGWEVRISLYIADGSVNIPVVQTEAEHLRLHAEGTYRGGELDIDFSGYARLGVGGALLLNGEILSNPRNVKVSFVANSLDVPFTKRLYDSLPKELQSVFDILSPLGSVDVQLSFCYEADASDDGETNVVVRVIPRGDMSVAVEWFPYRVGGIEGEVVYSSGTGRVSFKATSNWNGMNLLTTGELESKEGLLTLDVSASDVPIDDDTMLAMPSGVRNLVGELGLRGYADVNIKVRSSPDRTDFTVRIFPSKKITIRPITFPIPVKEIEGLVRIDGEGVHLQALKGSVNGGFFTVEDVFIPFEGKRDSIAFVNIDGVLLDEEIMGVICDEFGLNRSEWQAEAVVRGVLQFVVTDDELKKFGYLHLDNLKFRYADYPEIREGEGVLSITPEGLRIEWLRGRAVGGNASVWGEITRIKDRTKIRMRIDTYGLPLDANLRKRLPKWLREYWDCFSPSGETDFYCMLDGSVDSLRCRVSLDLKDVIVTPVWFPYEVRRINGEVTLDLDKELVLLSDISAEDGTITVDGLSMPIGEKRRLTTLNIWLNGVRYDERVAFALPDAVASVLNELNFNGGISGGVSVKVSETDEHTETNFNADIRLLNASINFGVRMDRIQGALRFSGTVRDDELVALSPLHLALSGLRVEGISIEQLFTELILSEGKVTAKSMEGSVYGGHLKGNYRIKEGEEKTEVSLFIRIKDMVVRSAAESLFGKRMKDVTGKASVSAELNIVNNGDKTAVKGRGRIRMEDSNLWEVPFFSLLIKALSLGVVSVPFNRAGCDFKIEDNIIMFSDVYFHSPIISLEGKGRLWFGGRMRFRFAIRFLPSFLKYIPVFSWIWDFIRNNIVQIKVKGTTRRPVITIAPFQPIADFFKGND